MAAYGIILGACFGGTFIILVLAIFSVIHWAWAVAVVVVTILVAILGKPREGNIEDVDNGS